MGEMFDSSHDVLAVKEHKANSLSYLTDKPRPKPRPASAAVGRRPAKDLPAHIIADLKQHRPRPSSAAFSRTGSYTGSETEIMPPAPRAPPPAAAPASVPPLPLGGLSGQRPPSAPPPPHVRKGLKKEAKRPPVVPPKPSTDGPFGWDPTAKLGPPRTTKERQAATERFFDEMYARHKSDGSKTITQRMIDGELGPCAPMDGVKRYPYTAGMRLYQEEFSALVCSTITHPYVTTSVNNSESIPFDVLSGMAYDDATLSGLKTWVSESERSFVPKDLKAAKNANGVGVRSECVQFLG